jgi:hypothetical protein
LAVTPAVEAPEVDQRLHRDRAGRHVDARRQDERGEARPERGEADEQAEAEIDEQVGRTPEADMAAAADEPVDAELEAEEEEQEDQPDLGHEVGHLRGLDQLDELRLVRPQDDPREEVGRNGREPEAARHQSEQAEQRDRDGELREGHAAILPDRGIGSPQRRARASLAFRPGPARWIRCRPRPNGNGSFIRAGV